MFKILVPFICLLVVLPLESGYGLLLKAEAPSPQILPAEMQFVLPRTFEEIFTLEAIEEALSKTSDFEKYEVGA